MKKDYEITIRENDLDDKDLGSFEKVSSIGFDTETTGLKAFEHDLHLIQICTDTDIFVVKLPNKESKNIKSVLARDNIVKIAHHAVFDCSFIFRHMGIMSIPNLFCTKMAAKLVEPKGFYGLGKVVEKYLGIAINKTLIKEARTPDGKYNWLGLTPTQIKYVTEDVHYLKPLAVNLTHLLQEMPDNNGKKMIDIARELFKGINSQAIMLAYNVRDDLYKHH